jgi:hypothetical protein
MPPIAIALTVFAVMVLVAFDAFAETVAVEAAAERTMAAAMVRFIVANL